MTETSSPNPLITLWYKPGQTLQGLIANAKGGAVAIVSSALFGLVQVWPAYSAQETSNSGLLLVGVFVGLAGLFLFSWLLRNFGRWFGGEAKVVEVRTSLGWGLLPWAVLHGGIHLLVLLTKFELEQMASVFFVILIYGFVILLSTLSVALRISLMKTFLCLLLTFLVSLFPLTLVMQLLLGGSGGDGG